MCQQFITHLAKSYKLETLVVYFPLQEAETAKNVIATVLNEIHSLRKVKDLDKTLLDLDQDARQCRAILSLRVDSGSTVIEFLSDCINKYPDNKEFWKLRGVSYSFTQRHEEALRDYNKLLEKEPDNYEVLYYKAVIFRLMRHQNTIKAYEEFISKAPIDERKVPEAYYAIGTCIFESSKKPNDKKIKEIKKYYNLGLDMEKKQLPFFLPYDSNTKMLLGPIVIAEKIFEEKEPVPSTNKTKLNDPLRKELIIQNRQFVNWNRKSVEKAQQEFLNIQHRPEPPKQQKLPNSLAGLKAIYLKEIDFTKDHILSHCILEVMVIDRPNRNSRSIMLVVEDKYENVQRVALYNLDEDLPETKALDIGSKFDIISPYIRMANDGMPLIRVDDPSSVVFGEKMKNMCSYCGDLDTNLVCGKCRVAKYCSKECQVRDWKVFKHKLICLEK